MQLLRRRTPTVDTSALGVLRSLWTLRICPDPWRIRMHDRSSKRPTGMSLSTNLKKKRTLERCGIKHRSLR